MTDAIWSSKCRLGKQPLPLELLGFAQDYRTEPLPVLVAFVTLPRFLLDLTPSMRLVPEGSRRLPAGAQSL